MWFEDNGNAVSFNKGLLFLEKSGSHGRFVDILCSFGPMNKTKRYKSIFKALHCFGAGGP